MKRNKQKPANRKRPTPEPAAKQPFLEHVYELRRRLFYIAMSVVGLSLAAYGVQQSIIRLLIAPAHGQQFIYTSPIGGVDFLFRVCLYLAVILSIPVIVYNVLRYLEPLVDRRSFRFAVYGSMVSGLLAAAGMACGYFVGLPAAMHFLLHQFITPDIKAMLTIQSYLSFVMVYMLGSALLFQVPLILLFINRIKPLKPRRLFHYERWVILGAFVMSGLMNPTPHLLDQLLIAGPLILMYQVGIGLIALINHRQNQAVHQDLTADARKDVAPTEPTAPSLRSQPKNFDFVPPASPVMPTVAPHPTAVLQPLSSSRKYIDGFVRPS